MIIFIDDNRKGIMDNQFGNSLDWNKATKTRRVEQLQKHNIQQTDGAKYMSYIKVTHCLQIF